MAMFKKIFKKFLGFEEELESSSKVFEEQEYKPRDEYEPIKDYPHEAKHELKEITLYPKNFADACDVVEQLELGNIVIVNMNDLDLDTCKRISDFILGAIYVLEGDVEKLSKRVFRFWTNE